MRTQADDYPLHIERAIRALLSGGSDAGAAALAPIAFKPRDVEKRPALPRATRCKIFRRDDFSCRYCGGKTILTPVMQLLGGLYPRLPVHVTRVADRAYAPSDHLSQSVRGSRLPWRPRRKWTEESNLVTACNPCNAIKGDFTLEQLGWELQDAEDDGWDGLVGLYRALWQAAGQPDRRYHTGWMRDLRIEIV